jgi:hypothetical protein
MCPFQFHRDPVLAAQVLGWVDANFREHLPQAHKKLFRLAKVFYRDPQQQEEEEGKKKNEKKRF